jgi:hypothetical protein
MTREEIKAKVEETLVDYEDPDLNQIVIDLIYNILDAR